MRPGGVRLAGRVARRTATRPLSTLSDRRPHVAPKIRCRYRSPTVTPALSLAGRRGIVYLHAVRDRIMPSAIRLQRKSRI